MISTVDAKSAAQTLQFLGLAFAGADLVFEVNTEGEIGFAVGAIQHLTGHKDDAIAGVRWTTLVSPNDAAFLNALLKDLQPGERRGPFRVNLNPCDGHPAREALLSAFRLPQNGGRVSCALSLAGALATEPMPRDKHGLVLKGAFDQAAVDVLNKAERAGIAARLELVELPGLQAAVAAMNADEGDRMLSTLAALLRAESYGGLGAAEVGPGRFALIAAKPVSAERLSARLQDACGQNIAAVAAPIALPAGAVAQKLKTIRYVLDRYIESGADKAASDFVSMVDRTARESARFRSLVNSGAFKLVYQPIVALAGETLHHFEALARFGDERGPAEIICLAEELGLILDFDLAVCRATLAALAKAENGVKIAVNISAASLIAPGFVDALSDLVLRSGVRPPRLLVEITKTTKVQDFELAKKKLMALRHMGHPVCLDDFGSGAASLEYVTKLDFDYIKIDGRYVKDLTAKGRESMLIKHIAALCNEMGVTTIAEMVETREATKDLISLGVVLGQGWAFGKPTDLPVWNAPSAAPGARRKGVVESWG